MNSNIPPAASACAMDYRALGWLPAGEEGLQVQKTFHLHPGHKSTHIGRHINTYLKKKNKKFGWGTLELWMSSDHILVFYWQNAHNSKLALWPELDCLWLMWEAISSPFLSCTYVQYHPWLKGEWKKLHSRGTKQGRHLQSICELTGLITMLMC